MDTQKMIETVEGIRTQVQGLMKQVLAEQKRIEKEKKKADDKSKKLAEKRDKLIAVRDAPETNSDKRSKLAAQIDDIENERAALPDYGDVNMLNDTDYGDEDSDIGCALAKIEECCDNLVTGKGKKRVGLIVDFAEALDLAENGDKE